MTKRSKPAQRSKYLKARLWAKATGFFRVRCNWCPGWFTFDEMVADHDPPLSEGGTPSGAVLSCIKCDAERSKETSRRMNERRAKKAKKHLRRKKRGRKP